METEGAALRGADPRGDALPDSVTGNPGPVDREIIRFKECLRSEPNSHAVVDRFVLSGECYGLTPDEHFDLRQEIRDHFSLDLSTIYVVGSAKLGFSIAPRKRWKRFDINSDIDVAIVNHDLYERVWHEIHDLISAGVVWRRREEYLAYLSRGWIRPDLLPASENFSFAGEWWEFFRSLKRRQVAGPYKVAAGLYHDADFLKSYQAKSIEGCRERYED